MAQHDSGAKFFYYKYPCYYDGNGKSFDDKQELKAAAKSHNNCPIHLVFPNLSVVNDFDHEDQEMWRWITDVIILDQEPPGKKFPFAIWGTLYFRTDKYALTKLLEALIGKAFDKEQYSYENAIDQHQAMIKDVEQRWKKFLNFTKQNPPPYLLPVNDES
jgi:hypothetical protein